MKRKSTAPEVKTKRAKMESTQLSSVGGQAEEAVHQPRNAVTIRNILLEMGVRKYKPRVIDQLMEFFQRYVRDILEDAYDYQQHAKNKTMGPQ
eukprot:431805-Amorphochlora_amoeboformis.AAC.1